MPWHERVERCRLHGEAVSGLRAVLAVALLCAGCVSSMPAYFNRAPPLQTFSGKFIRAM